LQRPPSRFTAETARAVYVSPRALLLKSGLVSSTVLLGRLPTLRRTKETPEGIRAPGGLAVR